MIEDKNKMKLRFTVEIELDEDFKDYLEGMKRPDEAIKTALIYEKVADIGKITKVSDIDYLMHEIKP